MSDPRVDNERIQGRESSYCFELSPGECSPEVYRRVRIEGMPMRYIIIGSGVTVGRDNKD